MISNRRLRDKAIMDAAADLAQLLRLARAQLPAAARICPACRHVFSLNSRLDMRCPDCAAAATTEERHAG
jgi:predicted Zn-ribbon and HTH transcriptional regulator